MKTVDLDFIRSAVADYMRSEGCSCCRGKDHAKHEARLGKLLSVPMYEDKSGYDFYQFVSDQRFREAMKK